MAIKRGTKAANTLTGSAAADFIYGLAGNDTLNGLGGGDHIYAGTGNDSVNAGDGNNIVSGDAGRDTIIAGSGFDQIQGGADNDSISAGSNKDFVRGQTGDDTIDGGAGADKLYGFSGNDSIFGGDDNDNIFGEVGLDSLDGGNGNDFLFGGAGNDTLVGGAGDDTINPGTGSDVVIGGAGSDWVMYDDITTGAVTVNLLTGVGGGAAAGDTYATIENVTGSIKADILTGDANANYLDGSFGKDTLYGGSGNDTLKGGSHDDWLVGGAGSDKIWGSPGVDTASYEGSSVGVNVRIDLGTASAGDAAGDTFINMESVKGSTFNDTLSPYNGGRADGGDGQDTIYSDQITVNTCRLDGGAGNDIDTLDGSLGSGAVNFVLYKDGAADVVNSFAAGSDNFVISKAAFGLAALATTVAVQNAASGHTATGTASVFVYDQSNHTLWYDVDVIPERMVRLIVDGTGATASTQVATLTTTISAASLAATDFILET